MFSMRPLFVLFIWFSCANSLTIREFPQPVSDEELQELIKLRPKSRFGAYIDKQWPRDIEEITDDDSSDENSNDEDEVALTLPLSSRSELVNGVACRMCSPGFGLVSLCTSKAETVCEPCVEGANFSDSEPHFKPCTPCSKCGKGMYTEVSCTTETDTFCDSCQAARQILGADIDNVLNPMLQNLEYLRGCSNLPDEHYNSAEVDTDLMLGAIEDEILETFGKSSQQEASESNEKIDSDNTDSLPDFIQRLRDKIFNTPDDVATPSTTVQSSPTTSLLRLASYPPNDVLLDDQSNRQSSVTSRQLATLVAIDAVPRRTAADSSGQTGPKPAVVAGAAALPDKVSSSLMGGFEVQLLPEPLQLAETNFGRAPMLKKALLKKSTTDRHVATSESTESSLLETASSGIVRLETEDVDDTLFIFDWLTGYDDGTKRQATEKINESPKGIIFKPSNHNYPYIRLVHSSDMLTFIRRQQRRLVAAALLVLAVFTIVAVLLALRCRRLRRQRRQARLVWSSGLTELDDKIIKECAQKMTQAHKVPRKFYRRNPFNQGFECDPQNDKAEEPRLVDNPLANYLEHEDGGEEENVHCSFNASTEHLVANDEKKSKSSTAVFV